MPWLDDVRNLILEDVFARPDPAEQLYEVLRWRGFLARRDGDRVELMRIWTRQHRFNDLTNDAERASLATCDGIEVILQDPKATWAEVRWREGVDRRLRKQAGRAILEIPSPSGGMTSAGPHAQFEQHFPAGELDHGVALLVRALNLNGVVTELSTHDDQGRNRLEVELAATSRSFPTELRGRCLAAGFSLSEAELVMTGGEGQIWERGKLWIGPMVTDGQLAFRNFAVARKAADLLLQDYEGLLYGEAQLPPPPREEDWEMRARIRNEIQAQFENN